MKPPWPSRNWLRIFGLLAAAAAVGASAAAVSRSVRSGPAPAPSAKTDGAPDGSAGRAPAGQSPAVDWQLVVARDPFVGDRPVEPVREERIVRDPGADLAVRRAAERELRLTGIVRGADERAVINGASVAVGGVVRGFTLVEIRFRSVVLEKDGVCVELVL